MNTFTLIVPYYRNVLMLREQIRIWEEYPPEVELVLIDDGSPEEAYAIVKDCASEALQGRIQLYRILIDVPWNRGGARNLGTSRANTQWVLHVDIDHVLTPASARALLKFEPSVKEWYRFERYRNGPADETRKKDQIPADQARGKIHPHMDSYLVTKRMFWEAGGYDEDYSGCLGGGSPFLKQLGMAGKASMAPAQVSLEVYTRTVIADASDCHLSRERDEYAERRKRKDAKGPAKATNPIRFEWIKEEFMYPPVAGEFETVNAIKTGKSIARFGDGELKVLDGNGYTRELTANPKLTKELRNIAGRPHPDCLVGIPTMDPAGTKYANWKRHKGRFLKYFRAELGIPYYSSLMTRPDCGPWLETREYYEHVISIWAQKKRIAVVSEPDSKLLIHLRLTHTDVVHVECPMYSAYAVIDRLETAVVKAKPDIALLSVGVTATCLAHRLAKRGIQAVDLGSIGGFLLRWYDGNRKPIDYPEERKPMNLAITPSVIASFEDKDSKIERFRTLYEKHEFIDAYSQHTDLRVKDNPKGAIGREDEWETHGALQLKFLIEQGMQPAHRLLDVGCGVGRGARRFVPYLEAEHYTGIDISSLALEHAKKLSTDEGWAAKRPAFWMNAEIDIPGTFDFIWAHSVFTHLPAEQIAKMIVTAGHRLAPGGRFLFTYKKGDAPTRTGLKQFKYPVEFFAQCAASAQLKCEALETIWPAHQRTIRLSKPA